MRQHLRSRRRRAMAAAIGGALVAAAVATAVGQAPSAGAPPTAGWLRALPPDRQIDAIDRQLRGFDMAMVEVGYRYTEMYFGAIEGNWKYALYTGEKLSWAMLNGLERRPRRRANAEQIFLQEAYPAVLDAIRKQDPTLFKERFDTLRAACNACHEAEKVEFIQVGFPTVRHVPLISW